MVISFDLMCKDEIAGSITLDTNNKKVLRFEKYLDYLTKLIVYSKVEVNDLYEWIIHCLKERRYDRGRVNLRDILTEEQIMDFWKELRYTKGCSTDDDMWIRFEGDKTTYSDINNGRC
jgi:hypothetical protein